MRHAESDIQQACVTVFRLRYPSLAKLFFAVPNGGARSAVEAKIMKAEGVTPGVSDTILLVPRGDYHGLCVEFKRQCIKLGKSGPVIQKTYQEPEQKEWQALVEGQGYKYAVVRSVEEFLELITNYL